MERGSYAQRIAEKVAELVRILLTFLGDWEVEVYTAIVISLLRSWKVQVRKRDFLGVLGREGPQGLADDGVILNFFLVLVAEDENRRRRGIRALFRMLTRRSGPCRSGPGIEILIALLAHSLLIEALLVHLIRQAVFVLLVLVGGRAVVPPPVGIDATPKIGIAVAIATTVSVTIAVAVWAGADSKTNAGMVEPSRG